MSSLKEKVFAIRVKLTRKKGRTVNPVLPVNPISAGRQTNSNNPAATSTQLQTANDGAQTILPGVATDVALIPIAGPPLAAAISGLVAILQGIDRDKLNTSDLATLLFELSGHLRNAPSALDPVEQMRRDSLARVLQETSDKLMQLEKRSIHYTPPVTQAIAKCTNKINEYLLNYSLASQMQMSHETHAAFAGVQSMQGPMTRISGVVTLVDATGDEHPILLECCTSLQRLNRMLETVFKRNTIQAEVQKVFLATGEYNLSIDHGNETTQLTSDNGIWPLEAGTKVVMRIVVKQRRYSVASASSHLCHFCRTRNWFTFRYNQKDFSSHCEGCKRQFKVSITEPGVDLEQRTTNARKKIKHGKIFNDYETEAKMQLIQNFHVKHEELLRLERERERERERRRLLELERELERLLERRREELLLFFRREEEFRRRLLEDFREFEREQERREHEEMMSRFETLGSDDDESKDDDSSSHAESWNGQEQEEHHRDDQDGHQRILS